MSFHPQCWRQFAPDRSCLLRHHGSCAQWADPIGVHALWEEPSTTPDATLTLTNEESGAGVVNMRQDTGLADQIEKRTHVEMFAHASQQAA